MRLKQKEIWDRKGDRGKTVKKKQKGKKNVFKGRFVKKKRD